MEKSSFSIKNLMKFDVHLNDKYWDLLRREPPGLEHFVYPSCTKGPRESKYNWYKSEIEFNNGKKYKDVEIRKKGFSGSVNPSKPSLKIKFSKEDNPQRRRFTLNNSFQDASYARQYLTYYLFRKADMPAPRCNFAKVSVNGKNLGIYINVEEVKKDFLKKNFKVDDGELYEIAFADFNDKQFRLFEAKLNTPNDRKDILEITDLLRLDNDDEFLEKINELVDIDHFITYWALEVITAHWDGYSGNRNNSFLYNKGGDKTSYCFIPWGVDQAFKEPRDWWSQFRGGENYLPYSVYGYGDLARKLINIPKAFSEYKSRLRRLLNTVWNEDDLFSEVSKIVDLLDNDIPEHLHETFHNEIKVIEEFISNQRNRILTEIDNEKTTWNRKPAPVLCGMINKKIIGTVSVDLDSVEDIFTAGSGKLFEVNDEGIREFDKVNAQANNFTTDILEGVVPPTEDGIFEIRILFGPLQDEKFGLIRIQTELQLIESLKEISLNSGDARAEFALIDSLGNIDGAGRILTGNLFLEKDTRASNNNEMLLTIRAPIIEPITE